MKIRPNIAAGFVVNAIICMPKSIPLIALSNDRRLRYISVNESSMRIYMSGDFRVSRRHLSDGRDNSHSNIHGCTYIISGLTDRVLTDTLTTAKIRRRLDTITQLLRQCQKLGPIADQANIVTSCLEAVVDSWLLTSKFSTR